MPNLIVERGREKGLSFEISAGTEFVVGRDPDTVQAVISDVAASRRHFSISQKDGRWVLADLQSRNGTYLNETAVDGETPLAIGDRIQVGETVFSFLEEEKAEGKGGLAGKEIGGYEILTRIGRGGMGTVYKARQKSLNRLVALKFLSPKLGSNPAFVNQFYAEARAAGQLNHPNVVQVFDVGQLAGLYYFSMEFMEGGAVQDLLTKSENSRLTWDQALPILMDAARGLAFAEKRGIIHRDIKPDNLMLTVENKVKIGDLGLAKSAEDKGSGETGIFGTPHFIAPEQAQGKDVTHAADIYSLGASFYRIVSGRTAFSGKTVKEILKAQINEPHKPLVQEIEGFPPDLAAIVDKMMAKKVEDRYQSASKLIEDLEAFQLAHQIELAGGIKSRKPYIIAATVVGLVAAGFVVWAVTKPPEIKKETVRETSVIRIGTTGPTVTPEQLQAQKNGAAENAILRIQVKEGPLGPIAIDGEKKQRWLDLAKEYDGIRAAHPEASAAITKKAADRAGEIRGQLELLEREKTEVIDKAKAWWKSTDDAVRGGLAAKRWGAAIHAASAALASEEWKRFEPHCPPDARSFLSGVEAQAFTAVNEDLAAAQKQADADTADGRPKKALADLAAWEEALRAQIQSQGTDRLGDAKYATVLENAVMNRTRRQEALTKSLNDALDADKALFVDAYLAVRHLPRAADDTGGPVFNFQFGEAAKQLRAATEGKLRSWIYRERCEAKIASLEQAQAAFEAWINLLGEKKIYNGGEEIRGLPGVEAGTRILFDGERPPTTTELNVLRVIGSAGSAKTQRVWADFTPSELHRTMIAPKLDKLPQDLALSMARMFAELAEADAMGELLERAGPSADAVALRAEFNALSAFAIIAKGEPGPVEQVTRMVENWRLAHHRSDTYILLDGRPGADMPKHLFAEEDIGRFLANWGEKQP
ncbi:MAG: Serine/threonine-protein kinase PknD [Planctomycetes bacterium]|nr:Serine/threonine-protein kinase PknD [Planctomycetota bacterium]